MLELIHQRADAVLKHSEFQGKVVYPLKPRQEPPMREVRTFKQISGIQTRLTGVQGTIVALADLEPPAVGKRTPDNLGEFLNVDFAYSMGAKIPQILHEFGLPFASVALSNDSQLTAPDFIWQKLVVYTARTSANRQVIQGENLNLLSGVNLDVLPNMAAIRFS